MGQQIYVSLKFRDDPELRFYLEKKLAKELIKLKKEKVSAVGKGEVTINRTFSFTYDFNKLEGFIDYNGSWYPFKIIIP